MEESEQPHRDPDQRRLAEAILRLSVRDEDARDEEFGARHFELWEETLTGGDELTAAGLTAGDEE